MGMPKKKKPKQVKVLSEAELEAARRWWKTEDRNASPDPMASPRLELIEAEARSWRALCDPQASKKDSLPACSHAILSELNSPQSVSKKSQIPIPSDDQDLTRRGLFVDVLYDGCRTLSPLSAARSQPNPRRSVLQTSELPYISPRSPTGNSTAPGFDLRMIGDGSFLPNALPASPGRITGTSPRRQLLMAREALHAMIDERRQHTMLCEERRRDQERLAAARAATAKAAKLATQRVEHINMMRQAHDGGVRERLP